MLDCTVAHVSCCGVSLQSNRAGEMRPWPETPAQGGKEAGLLGPAGRCHRASRAPSHGVPTRKGLVLVRATNGAADTGMEVVPQ